MIYIPQHFSENDRGKLYEFMRQHNFATLIVSSNGEPSVTLLPVLVDEATNIVRAHVARANPLWHEFSPEREVQLLFHGPHHYISPSWYQSHPSVPTWNYAATHVTGFPRIVEERSEIEAMLNDLVQEHEAALERPWAMDLPAEYKRKMVDAIVAFEIHITRMSGKFKLSQNRPATDLPGVIAELEKLDDTNATGVAQMMRENQKR